MKKIPFVSQLQKIRSIPKRNEAFNNLTPEEQRKEIAYEGLKLVINGLVKGSHGCYWSYDLQVLIDGPNIKTSKELQKALLTKLPKVEDCRVCQRGLMMLSQIRLSNNLEPRQEDIDRGYPEIIRGFNMNDFHDMESEYENDINGLPYMNNTDEKLALVCCNVIANGNFDMNDKTNYLQLWDLEKYFKFIN